MEKENDIISMRVNLADNTISWKYNDKIYDNIEINSDSDGYHMAVYMGNVNTEIQLLSVSIDNNRNKRGK